MISKFTIAAIIISSVLSTPIFSNFKFKEVTQEEISSKFGGYVIPTANLSKTCAQYKLDDILYDDTTVDAKHKKLREMFSNGRNSMEKWIKGGDDADRNQAILNASSYAIPSIILVLLSLACTPLFIIYFFCKSCCCTKKGKRSEAQRNRGQYFQQHEGYFKRMNRGIKSKTSHKCFLFTNTVLTLILIVGGGMWMNLVNQASKGAGKSECAASHFFNDVRGGVKDDKVTFGGIDGLLYLFGKFTEEIKNVDPNKIDEYKLNDKNTALTNSMAQFYKDYKNSTIDSCNPQSPEGTKLTPDLIQNLAPSINDDVQFQLGQMGVGATIISFAGNTINEIKSGAGQDILDAIDSLEETLKDFRSQMTEIETSLNEDINLNSRISTFDSIFGFIIGSALFVLLLNLVMMYKGIKGHKNNYKWQIFMSILKMIFSLVVNIIAFLAIGKTNSHNNPLNLTLFSRQCSHD